MSFQTDLGCLLMCDTCIAWFNCGIPASGSRACLDWLLGSYIFTGLPYPVLIQRVVGAGA